MRVKLPVELEGGGPFAVRTRSLIKRYGDTTALARLELTVPEGSVYVLVGQNGVGKSTALRVLLDLVVPDAGTAEVLGLDTHEQGARVRAQIGYVPERDEAAYAWLRVDTLLQYHAAYYPAWDSGYAGELTRLFEIRPSSRLGKLSKGQQRRVQLVLALAHCPPVLLLDEPMDGLDPITREQALSALAGHLARFPTTILMSTHQVHEADRLADHVGVMRAGRLDAQLSRETLRRSLHRYHLSVPDAWPGVVSLADRVLRRSGTRRDVAWTIWGAETEVAERLRAAGAAIRQIEPLGLEDAALALLAVSEPDEVDASVTPRPMAAGV